MQEIKFIVSDAVWNFLNKKGEPADVAKQIVESAWEMDGWEAVLSEQDGKIATKFATTLIFTNGKCPICKQQVYKQKPGFMMSVDPEVGAKHFLSHSQEDRRAYAEKCEEVGI